jgi:predicted AAA+ superfamily ATPase
MRYWHRHPIALSLQGAAQKNSSPLRMNGRNTPNPLISSLPVNFKSRASILQANRLTLTILSINFKDRVSILQVNFMTPHDFQRNITPYLADLLKQFPVVGIIGARQVGKTTLAKTVAKDFLYMDLELNSDFDRLTHDPEFFFKQNPSHVIFDEAQLLPTLFPTLRSVIDSNRQEKGRFIITGSSSPELLDNISESLAGRIAILELGTLKANEFYQKPMSAFYQMFSNKLSKENISIQTPQLTHEEVQNFWLKGGYPEPILQDKNFYREWMTSYQQTYINRDIAQLFPRLNTVNYRRFISMLGKLSSKLINKSDLARSLNVSQPTITDYLNIADGTFIWRQLLSFENNVTKSVIKMPRGHIRDSGLLHNLLHIDNLSDLQNDPCCGFSFEGFVIEEILKGLQDARVRNFDAYYYRTRSGAEIDLILEGTFGLLPIEIKYGYTTTLNQLRTLNDFIQSNNLPFGILVNQSDRVEWINERILQVPTGCL